MATKLSERPWDSREQFGGHLWHIGELGKLLEEDHELLRLDPDNQGAYYNLAGILLAYNRLEEAEALCKQAGDRKLNSEGLVGIRYLLGFLKGDTNEMTQAVSKGGVREIEVARIWNTLLPAIPCTICHPWLASLQRPRPCFRPPSPLS